MLPKQFLGVSRLPVGLLVAQEVLLRNGDDKQVPRAIDDRNFDQIEEYAETAKGVTA
jgi:hypothetical protein